MKVVMGALNGVRLFDLMNGATGHCSRVTAAVAYATGNNPFFDHCLDEKISLEFYGLLDEDGAVAVPVLQKLLDAGPLAVNCRLIKGHFHSKIIWWHGYTPEKGKLDKDGQVIEQRQYNTKDFDRTLVLEKRTKLVASKVWEYLKATDPMAKTIVFCDDQDHAERMRQELVKLIPAAASNRRYVMRITGDDNEGKAQLSYFIDNDEPFPVIEC